MLVASMPSYGAVSSLGCWPATCPRATLPRHSCLPANKRHRAGLVYDASGAPYLGNFRQRPVCARSSLVHGEPVTATSTGQAGADTLNAGVDNPNVAASELAERGIPFVTDGAFYRDGSIISRDLALLAVAAHAQRLGRRDLRVLDAMAGCGVRALRYGKLDCVSFVWANDASRRTHRALVANLGSLADRHGWLRTPMGAQHGDGGKQEGRTDGEEELLDGSPCQEGSVGAHVGSQRTDSRITMGTAAGAARSVDDGDDTTSSADESSPLGAWGKERWMGEVHVTDAKARWRVTHTDVTKLLMHCYQSKDYFDVVDVDAFGSNITAVEAAVDAVRHGGLLYLTATDGFVAGGHRTALSLAKYGSHTVPVPFANEQGIRVLIGAAARAAGVRGKQVIPVFSLYSQHGPVFRALLRVVKQRDPAWLLRDHRFLACCPHCEETRAVAWDGIARDSVCTCEASAAAPGGPLMTLTGPMWAGPLHSAADVGEMKAVMRAWGWQKYASPSARQGKHTLEQLLEMMQMEADEELKPGYVWLKELASKGRLSKVPHRGDLMEALRKEGFKACRSHIEPNVIKTNAPVSKCIEVAVQIHKP